jgi:hypothetical protein
MSTSIAVEACHCVYHQLIAIRILPPNDRSVRARCNVVPIDRELVCVKEGTKQQMFEPRDELVLINPIGLSNLKVWVVRHVLYLPVLYNTMR